MGTAQPAAAASLNFDCNVLGNPQTFPVDITSSAPAQLPTGSSTTPDLTTVVTIPAGLADALRGLLQASSFSGVIHSTTLVNDVPQAADLTVPQTGAGAPGTAIPLTATGSLAPITAGNPGDVTTLAAGAQDVVMTLVTPGGDQPLEVLCTPGADQDLTFGTITSVKDGSKTAAKAAYSAKHHAVASSAKVTSAHGIVPASGKVKFVLKRGSTAVGSVTEALNDSGKATAAFTGVRKSGSYTVVASYKGSDLLKGSKDSAGFTVH
ncbi:hypothetical protein GCM10022242_19630 [Nocardioides panacisoli]|uniref:Ig-like domain repeat protein n=2 Tax=Nocardioides panacisoli TaxID=627624 RepID=A0ABP7IGH5_9ACTN